MFNKFISRRITSPMELEMKTRRNMRPHFISLGWIVDIWFKYENRHIAQVGKGAVHFVVVWGWKLRKKELSCMHRIWSVIKNSLSKEIFHSMFYHSHTHKCEAHTNNENRMEKLHGIVYATREQFNMPFTHKIKREKWKRVCPIYQQWHRCSTDTQTRKWIFHFHQRHSHKTNLFSSNPLFLWFECKAAKSCIKLKGSSCWS
jgi:hypothetical protein